MNINISVKCDSCSSPTNCRVGMSNRLVQPLCFACPDCTRPIDITLRLRPAQAAYALDIVGATQCESGFPFDDQTNFVDLHLDFPVVFEKYVPGNTPFLRALGRLGHDALAFHSRRLEYLDAQHANYHTFGVLLKHFARGKLTPFRTNLKTVFNIDMASEEPQDVAAALYELLATVMFPFAFPKDSELKVNYFVDTIGKLRKDSPDALRAFVEELVRSGFLSKLRSDCLSIYPRIIESELALRPALFLDFDIGYQSNQIAMRVSTSAFDSNKDIYKDIVEIIARQYVLVAGVNNLLKRANHNQFLPGIGKTKAGKDLTPPNLDAFAQIDLGKKFDFVDDPWYTLQDHSADNQLRNAIAHYKTDYDEVTQKIAYYPKKDGLEASTPKEVQFLEFMRRLLIAYREMHRLHHLIKALFYYKYLIIDRAPQHATSP
jgi:hypothetical protein